MSVLYFMSFLNSKGSFTFDTVARKFVSLFLMVSKIDMGGAMHTTLSFSHDGFQNKIVRNRDVAQKQVI